MGSYAGSSDWDDMPSRSSFSTFKPKARRQQRRKPASGAKAAAPPVVDDDADLVTEGPADRKRLNVIFAFDTTGSMTPWVENVQEKMDYLAAGLIKLMDTEIALIGVGDHGDGRNMLQIKLFSDELDQLKQNIRELAPTDGQDTPEAFECLFKVLNNMDYEVPTVLVLVTDSIPHDMENYQGDDDGCPFGVDYREELEELAENLQKVYLVTCAEDKHILELQEELVGANSLLRLPDFRRLTNLVMAICMDEVGELDYFMNILEKQRGAGRKAEVLQILGRA